jgi:dipicolinate synthase subunit A
MMDTKQKFFICGGDLRQLKLADSLAADGYDTAVYGFGDQAEFEHQVTVSSNISEGLAGRDIIVLPLPCSTDNETVNMPLCDTTLSISELFQEITNHQIVVAGKVSPKIQKLAELYHIVITDYFQREELAVLNAIPTAEGAIQIAMEELPYTIHGLSCLVLGFGRIGKLLSHALTGLGANVTVEARKYADLAWIKAYGYQGLPLAQLKDKIGQFDLIINTIPFVVLDDKMLKQVKKSALIIDLASKPGGVDFDCATRLGKKVIWALSLPGSIAPVTAGIMIKDTILNLLQELGV